MHRHPSPFYLHEAQKTLLLHLAFLLLLASFSLAFSPSSSAQDDVSRILANVRKEFNKIEDYSASLHAVVNVPGVKAPPMDATVYFKQPDKVHVEAKGFAMLPRDVVAFQPSMFQEDLFDAVIQGIEKIDGITCTKVKLLAKSDTVRLQRIIMFIDTKKSLIMKMSFDPSQGGSGEVFFRYVLIAGKYFLPLTISLTMNTPALPQIKKFQNRAPKEQPKPSSARVDLTYSHYKVNTGIPDSIFKEKK